MTARIHKITLTNLTKPFAHTEALDCSPLYARNPVGRWIAWALRPVGRRSGIPSGLNPAAWVFGLRLPAANARGR